MDSETRVHQDGSSSIPTGDTHSALYAPLLISGPFIRLLELVPSAVESDIVECRLDIHSLDFKPRYIALSYVWGDPSDTEAIVVNSRVIQVTKNLASALRHLRLAFCLPGERTTTYVWADAVCINQGDVIEKNSQVKMMASIYSAAYMVIAWLGTDDDNDQMELGFDVIQLIEEELGYPGARVEDVNWMQKHPWLLSSELHSGPWAALDYLLTRPYWFRIWILQEQVFAQRLWIMAGKRAVNYTALRPLFNLTQWTGSGHATRPSFLPEPSWVRLSMKGFTPPLASFVTVAHYQNFVEELNEVSDGEKCLSILLTQTWEATDPRDKIFALQALVGNMIPPDYNKSVYEVYCEFSKKCISATGLECLLFYCGRGVYQSDDLNLPSWVPDFHRLSTVPSMAPLWTERGLPANRGLAEFSDSELEVLSDYVLRAPGSTCDTITRVEPEYRLESTEFLRFCGQYITPDTNAMYPSGIPLLQALVRTLLMENHYIYGPESRLLDPSSREMLTVMLITICLIGRANLSDSNFLENIDSHLREFRISPSDRASTLVENLLPGVASDRICTLEESILDLLQQPFQQVTQIWRHVFETLIGRHIFHTTCGYLGLGPPGVQPGDFLCVLRDMPRPVVLRKYDSHYIYIGPCFVLGYMKGEAAQFVRMGHLRMQDFQIH